MTASLFDHLLPEPSEAEAPSRTIARVAMERGIDKLLDYAVPAPFVSQLFVGQRVRVPLGRKNKPAYGFVTQLTDRSDHPSLKTILAISDRRQLIGESLMKLALWISKYYFTPLGLVIENMLPAAVKKRTGMRKERIVKVLKTQAELHALIATTKPKKRRALLARLTQLDEGQSIELGKLAIDAGVKIPAVISLARTGAIRIEQVDATTIRPKLHTPGEAREAFANATLPNLFPDQRRVIDSILPTLVDGQRRFAVHLVHGVTGSGKTEVYLRLIARLVELGRGAIVLVPEIALTPQTVRRFTERFPRVAVMHSALGQVERHRQWQRIADGEADIVVGARSAVFAPHPRLGMIVVDEEHEPSYKQDQAPRYHGRDVAIKRAQIENIPILLGSATPSLEMWTKAQTSKDLESTTTASSQLPTSNSRLYHLHSLPSRISDRALPVVEIVDMKQANKGRKGVHLLSPRLELALTHTINQKQQAILLLNRRGYSNFIYCSSCQQAVGCRFCDKTMTYHRASGVAPKSRTTEAAVDAGQIQCHYCLAVQQLPPVCPTCGKKLSLFGLGTQRVEEELSAKFPGVAVHRVDSDTMRGGRDYEAIMSRFAVGELQVLMGTQMLAKGLDFPNVTLVGVINGDTALSLPDFRAAERTFQLLTQVAGRAGRGEKPGRVIIQSFLPEDPTIQGAISQDFVAFATRELESRREINLPPFARQVRIVVRDQSVEKLNERSEELAAILRQAIVDTAAPVDLRGPMPAAVGKIAGYYRMQILLQSPGPGAVQNLLGSLRQSKNLISSETLAIDVDPISLL